MIVIRFGLFIKAPKQVEKPELGSNDSVTSTSFLIKWMDLPDEEVHGTRKNWILAYAPVRDRLDYTVFIGSHYRVKRSTFKTVTDGLQTDW